MNFAVNGQGGIMPLISIVTRHIPSRGEGFERLVKSLLAQVSQDYQHLVIYNEPLGLLDANQSLARHADEVTGDYVLIVDDDDWIVNPDLVMMMDYLQYGRTYKPDLILIRLQLMGELFPDDEEWNKLYDNFPTHLPQHGKISSSNYIIRREIYQQYIHEFGVPDSGDFYFMSAVYKHPGLRMICWNETVVAVDHIGKHDRHEEI
jgi:hypothetical protein